MRGWWSRGPGPSVLQSPRKASLDTKLMVKKLRYRKLRWVTGDECVHMNPSEVAAFIYPERAVGEEQKLPCFYACVAIPIT